MRKEVIQVHFQIPSRNSSLKNRKKSKIRGVSRKCGDNSQKISFRMKPNKSDANRLRKKFKISKIKNLLKSRRKKVKLHKLAAQR